MVSTSLLRILLYVAIFLPQSQAAMNLDECLAEVRKDSYGPIGLNSTGHPVNSSDATAISYSNCVEYCGAGQEPFRWSVFSQQFSSWLLPWLALVSQLPFGANDRLINFEAMLLTVGSPALAGYSLALTALNGRWIARRFSAYHFPNVGNTARILSSLQQSPLRVTDDEVLLASLIVLPQNDEWWEELVEWLDYTYSWSISAVTSLAWVIIAYVFTIIDSFTGDIMDSIQSNGQGIGSLWVWLLPIIIGWLQISPKCDSIRLRKAIERANAIAFVAQEDGTPVRARCVSSACALYLDFDSDDTLRVDEKSTVPIYNYARFLPWVETVEKISEAYMRASYNTHQHRPVSRAREWTDSEKGQVPGVNRTGSSSEVAAYCGLLSLEALGTRRRRGSSCIVPHVFIASMCALLLQWGSSGAAMVIAWSTPTRGLGCRSGSYLIYGILGTVAWILLVASSILSHNWVQSECESSLKGRQLLQKIASRKLAIALRRSGKFIASANAIWILILCMFQLTSFYDRCFCDSSIFSLRSRGYNLISPLPEDLASTHVGWSAGFGLAGASAIVFIAFVSLLINPTIPE